MRALTRAFALALLAGGAAAQAIDVTAADRDYFVIATGYDYEFDDGVAASDATTALSGAWEQDVTVDLDDWWNQDISAASAFHESDVWDGGLTASLGASAWSYGASIYYADGWSETGYDVTFEAHEHLRYTYAVDASTTDAGYAVATVILSGPQGNLSYVRVWDGDGESDALSGWLPAGEYRLDALAEAVVIVGTGTAETSVTTIDLDLRVFQAADYDTDGDVDRRDRRLFRDAYLAGSASADYDADGEIDAADWLAFRAAWNAAQTSEPRS